jgi:uncharacterized protein YndB with AHSA1/START domain
MTTPTPSTGRRGSATVDTPSDTTILIVRRFDAPLVRVFQCYTSPDLVRRWWSGDRGITTQADIDLRVGGSWRYVMTANGGFEVAFHGEYREVDPPHRLVHTEVFEGFPDGEALVTVTFDEVDGVTTIRALVEHSCQEHRDMHLQSGMEAGMQEAYDHLEALAGSPAA